MNPWHLEETREHILRLYGRDQLELARPCLRSVDDRLTYARIHFHEAKELLGTYVNANLQDAPTMLWHFARDDEAWGEFNHFIRRLGTYLIACIQSMHSVPDILAHAVHYSLGLNRSEKQPRPRDICISWVSKKLQLEADASQLCSLMIDLSMGGTFPHLAALANHSKHRSLVFPAINEDWTGQRAERHTIMCAFY